LEDDGDAVDDRDDDEGCGDPGGNPDRLWDLRRDDDDGGLADQVGRAECRGVDPPRRPPWRSTRCVGVEESTKFGLDELLRRFAY
jgi:hypothetical protein